VLGLERFGIAHDRGSSHGHTRIIRLAYYEHPSYVPLLRRSYELWQSLGAESAEPLLVRTGSIDASTPGHDVFEGSLRSCELHDVPHEVLDGDALARRFPGYRFPTEARALFQPDGGILVPEACIAAHVAGALAHGAELRTGERVLACEPRGDGVRVTTDAGVYDAARLVLSAGAWTGSLVAELAPLAVPERQVVAWFRPRRPELFAPERFPVFNVGFDEGRFYGFPRFGIDGFKIGRYHHLGETVDPDAIDRTVHPRDIAPLAEFTARWFPDATGPTIDAGVCMFANSPDEHFVIDRMYDGRAVVAAGFSGHGFKFCSVVGEIVADLALDGGTRHDVGLFRMRRG
jgi:sarcosine oxidase